MRVELIFTFVPRLSRYQPVNPKPQKLKTVFHNADNLDRLAVNDCDNKVRQRPSVNMPLIKTTDKSELQNSVRSEHKYELSGEGLWLFDIRRWKIAKDVANLPVLGRMKKSCPLVAPIVNELCIAYYANIPIAQQGESSDFKMRVVDIRSFDKNREYRGLIPYLDFETYPLVE